MKKNMERLGRWIAFFPLSILASYLAWLVVYFMNKWSMDFEGYKANSFYGLLIMESMSGFAMGAVFILSATYIAPSKKKFISSLMTVIAILFAVISVFFSIKHHDYWAVYSAVCFFVGALIVHHEGWIE